MSGVSSILESFPFQIMPSTELINEMIMCTIIGGMRTDNDAFTLCEIMKQLVDCSSAQQFVEQLQHGKQFLMYKLQYVYSKVCIALLLCISTILYTCR